MGLEAVETNLTLSEFFRFIWGESDGFAYLVTKTPDDAESWNQHFFEWPAQESQIIDLVETQKVSHEVYYGPALFKEPSSKKQHVKQSQVVWCEFDGTTPNVQAIEKVGYPTVRVISSHAKKHEHWYWKLDEAALPYDFEKVNRAITYLLEADASGWDASQVLRPIGTFNHKRSREVRLSSINSDRVYNLESFQELPEPPPPVDVPVPNAIPEIKDFLGKYSLPTGAKTLFQQGVPQGSRSDGLVALSYYLAEAGMTNEEMFAMLLNADERWGKFKGRADQHKRLMEIVVKGKSKYPKAAGEVGDDLVSIGFKSLLASDIKLEWVWPGYLQKAGGFLLSGPPGVGKTQFALAMAEAFCTGRSFLDKEVEKPLKIGFFSLEMGYADLKHFLQSQAGAFSEDEKDLLEQNLRLFPMGEPLYVSREAERRRVEKVIEDEKLDGIIVDSLGSMTDEGLNSDTDAKRLMDWLDHIRASTGIFTGLIHHQRKASGDNKKPNKLSDVYGSVYVTARPTTVCVLWPTNLSSTLELRFLKVRLSATPEPVALFRDTNLQFTVKDNDVSIYNTDVEEDEDTGPSKNGLAGTL